MRAAAKSYGLPLEWMRYPSLMPLCSLSLCNGTFEHEQVQRNIGECDGPTGCRQSIPLLWSEWKIMINRKTCMRCFMRSNMCGIRLCHITKGFLIASSTSGGMEGRIIRNLAFLFFRISSIFRFFSNKNCFPCLYIPPSITSPRLRFRTTPPV